MTIKLVSYNESTIRICEYAAKPIKEYLEDVGFNARFVVLDLDDDRDAMRHHSYDSVLIDDKLKRGARSLRYLRKRRRYEL